MATADEKWHQEQVEITKIMGAEAEFVRHIEEAIKSFAPKSKTKLSTVQKYKILVYHFARKLHHTIF